MPLHIQQQTYLKMMEYHLYQSMKITNHLDSHLNIAIIQMVPFFHHNKLMIGGQEKKQDMVYIINTKNLELVVRLPGLQNIFRAKLMAIHATLKVINEEYPNEPAYIFTDYLNGLYVIKTQIKHPTMHNKHPDKTILQETVQLLQQRTQPTTLYMSTCKHCRK